MFDLTLTGKAIPLITVVETDLNSIFKSYEKNYNNMQSTALKGTKNCCISLKNVYLKVEKSHLISPFSLQSF